MLRRRVSTVAFLMTALFAQAAIASAADTGFLERVYTDDAGDHKYTVFVPKNYDESKQWPVILFLHSADQRGNDGQAQVEQGLGPAIKEQADSFPFIAVFPQAEDTKGRILTAWSPESPDGARALKILETVEKDFRVDPQQRIVTGWSMGGYGTWLMGAAKPDFWSALVPISGGGDPAIAKTIKDIPVWCFHGAKDPVVKIADDQQVIDALRKLGANPHFTVYPEAEHDAWKLAYRDPRLYTWMLDPAAPVKSTAPLLAKPRDRSVDEQKSRDAEPFVPALEIPSAISVRLGNDLLKAMAETIPQVTPPDVTRGVIANIGQGSSVQGVSFSTTLYGINYSGRLVRARVKAYTKDKVNVQVGLSDVRINISGASITGSSGPLGGGRYAQAGPMSISLGYRRPIWISFDVTPYIVNQQLKLRLRGTYFRIPDDNWSVSGPNGISASGLGMDEGRIASSLRSGLYGSKSRIENEILAAIPPMVAELEKKIDLSPAGKLVTGLWPLPVYKPRVRVWPQSVSTDDKGISIVLGATAAAIDARQAPPRPRVIAAVGPDAQQVPQTEEFQFGLAPNMLGPLTQMLIDDDAARIHLLDTPIENFKKLADRQFLSEVIPDLKHYGPDVQIWSELIMTEPLQIVDAPAKTVGEEDVAQSTMRLQLPRLLISLAIKTDASSETWTPYAELEFSASQRVIPTLQKPTSLTRALALQWQGQPELNLQARFAPDLKPEDDTIELPQIREVLLAGWAELTEGGTASRVDIADFDLGYSKLRANDITWAPPQIVTTFGAPGVKITNEFDQPLVYETKGPYSDWSAPYTLPSGESHYFAITYPLMYRRQVNGSYQVFTLPVGSHSAYSAPIAGKPPQLYQAREQPQENPTTDESPRKDSDAQSAKAE
ncbi:Prolyl oligopeptidase family protein [Symmachiella dynata]|uniref:carboxylesterase family protein n=1 Tax=Symmachiella dynata TaxID=2527995 RepID=UPI00118CA82D|nr:dienelactone hydrolase family protein [Symmachiella dynata]QDT47112.1 Prolyl oligopeptidase family protein [Symmachiella dynata]